MKKTVMFALPLVAIMLAVACKKQEAVETAAPAATEQVAAPVAAPEAAPAVVTPAPAPVAVKPVAKKVK